LLSKSVKNSLGVLDWGVNKGEEQRQKATAIFSRSGCAFTPAFGRVEGVLGGL
jgi:hypothetical protein